ncbi:MAG: hypothetical protein ACHQ9S_18850 [Candidatus Binatia bacterium]
MPVVTQTNGGQSSAAINGQSLDYISQQVLQQCPGCPDALAQSVLQNVIREFYYKSTGWRETIGPYTVTKAAVGNPSSATVYLNPIDQYSQCHLVLNAFLFPDTSGGNLPRALTPSLRPYYGTDVGAPLQYYMDGPDKMILYPYSDQNYGNILYVYMSLMPVVNVGTLPNISITHHFDGLLYGTLWRLCTMPNKPWSIKDRAVTNEFRNRFRQEILVARDIATRGYGPADGKIIFPQFAGRGSQHPAASGGNFVRG